jgi:hypothetical protein
MTKLMFGFWVFFLQTTAGSAVTPPPSEVIVLCTLHQMHEQTSYYSYADLSAAIEKLRPDVLALELSEADLKDKVEQKTKREYQNSVYPRLRRHPWITVAMEPSDPRRSELIGLLRQSEQSLSQSAPQKDEAFDTYTDTVFKYLLSEWHSAADVNSSWTDRILALKHQYQDAVYGPKEQEGWEGWNQYFLQQILDAAKQNPGKRIVVIVGVEHGYWLRGHLREQGGVELGDTEELLRP